MSDLISLIERLHTRRILVVGDVMLDRFVEGTCERLSPEAPVPVLRRERETVSPGGAGNAAANVAEMGGRAALVSIIGGDDAGYQLNNALASHDRIEQPVIGPADRKTIVKTRFAAGQHLLRVDDDTIEPLNDVEIEALQTGIKSVIDGCHAVLISDYCKGTLADTGLVKWIIGEAAEIGIPVIVDSKHPHFERYSGATAITPNLHEFEAMACQRRRCSGDDEIASGSRNMITRAGFKFVIVTRGADGATLVTPDSVTHEPSLAPETVDVSGAGDTFAAALALAVSLVPPQTALRFANIAAGVAVQKLGTAAVTTADLIDALATQPTKLAVDPGQVSQWIGLWRRQGLKVGFTNGVFDLLHADHVAFLRRCREHCHRLIVGINSDISARKLKGNGRPVYTAEHRARILSALEDVDMVVIFEQDTPQLAIEHIKPDVLMKGDDYRLEDVVGADFVRDNGGSVVLVPRGREASTTETIRHISEAMPSKGLGWTSTMHWEKGPDLNRTVMVESDFDRARYWLYNEVLPWWQRYGTWRLDGPLRACEYVVRDDPRYKSHADFKQCRSLVQSRQIAVFSHAGASYRATARNLMLGFSDYLHPEGGVVHAITEDGHIDRTRTLYDQAFALFAHAHYLASGIAQSPATVKRSVSVIHDFIERELGAGEGYWPSLVHAGNGADTLQDSVCFQDDHMHLFEAYLALYRATFEDVWRWRAAALLDFVRRRMIIDDVIYETFDANMEPTKNPDFDEFAVSPGHHFEWVSLLLQYWHVQDKPNDDIPWLAARLYRKGLGFIDYDTGAVPYRATPDGRILDDSRRLWPQCEALRAHHAMASHWPQDTTLYRPLERCLRGILEHHADGPHWHEWVHESGPTGGNVPASSLYHLYFGLGPLVAREGVNLAESA